MSFDTKKGFYVSTVILDAPWEEELEKIETVKGEHLTKACQEDRNFDEYMSWLSFKSLDGKPETKPSKVDDQGNPLGELPEHFSWTPLYFNNPALKATIDWFPVEKTRVRIGRSHPGKYLQLHYDWDNARHQFSSQNHMVRIWVQLEHHESWYRLSNGDVDVNFKLQRGQFVVLDVDTIFHAVENADTSTRSNLIINCMSNSWIKNLPDLFPKRKLIDPRVNDNQ